jgi:AraC-like DNA-binding protein
MKYSIVIGGLMEIITVLYDKSSYWYGEESGASAAWTLVLATYGKCVYWIEEKKVVLEKGQLLLIPIETKYYGKSIPSVVHEKYVVQFSDGKTRVDLPILQQKDPIRYPTGKYEWMLDRFRAIQEQWKEKPAYYHVLSEALLTEVLVHMNRELDQGLASEPAQQLVDQMKTYIQNHYREHVTKEELGVSIDRSPNHAATLFRKITGQTISEFVHALRIKNAIYMLQHSALSVTEISEFVGFKDPSYFYRVFKRITGRVPMEYMIEREDIRK